MVLQSGDRGRNPFFWPVLYAVMIQRVMIQSLFSFLPWSSSHAKRPNLSPQEGRIPNIMVDHMRIHYYQVPGYQTAEWWAKNLMKRLLGITHKQWLYRNARVHLKKRDGKTEVEHEKIMKKVKKMMDTDLMELLERDRHLLLTEDFEQLGQAPSSYREYWVAEMETAIESSAKTKRQTTIDHTGKLITLSTHSEPPVIDTEGSIRYRRRRKK